jgi:hypothetical protein
LKNIVVGLIVIVVWLAVFFLLTKGFQKLLSVSEVTEFKTWIKKNLHVISAFILSALLVPMVAYVSKFGINGLADDPSHWGQMGDFFGGLLNPILAFASFMALLYTIQIQSKQLAVSAKELEATRIELTASREAQEKSSKALDGQLENLKIQQFESTFFSLIGQVRLASMQPDKKAAVMNSITWSANLLSNTEFESELVGLSNLSSKIFDSCKSSNAFNLRYLSLITSSIVYVDENLQSEDQKTKYLSILSIYANEVESYLLYLWLASFNYDLTGERRKAREIINQYGFFRELITYSGADSMNMATVFNAKQHEEQIYFGNDYVKLLRIKLSHAGYFSSCILGSPYPETILPVDISPQ